MTQQFLQKVSSEEHSSNPLFFFDSSPCHKKNKVKEECDLKNIMLEHIPPRMACLLQPLDVSIMRSFKSNYHTNWRD